MDALTAVAAFGILLSLVFAFTNGYNDAGADVATIVSSGASSVKGALLMAAASNFIGAIIGGSAVVLTLQGVLTNEIASVGLAIFSAVAAANIWNVVTWYYGIPSSSTHALIGGLIGVGIAFHGLTGVNWGWSELLTGQLTGVAKVIAFLLASVVLGFGGSFIIMKLARLFLRKATVNVNRPMKRLQWFTTGIQTLSHGANDAQKQMALVALLLMAMGSSSLEVPLWVRVACAAAMAIGTLGGGYRIMRTVGRKIFKIRPVHALVAQANTSLTMIFATSLGAPVSSTQVVTAGVMGVGSAENRRLVHWRVGKDLVVSWFMTIPAAAVLSVVIVFVMRALLEV